MKPTAQGVVDCCTSVSQPGGLNVERVCYLLVADQCPYPRVPPRREANLSMHLVGEKHSWHCQAMRVQHLLGSISGIKVKCDSTSSEPRSGSRVMVINEPALGNYICCAIVFS